METDQVGQWSSTNQANNSSSPSSLQSSYNSSYGSNSGQKLFNCSSTSIPQVPGGVVTTQNISTVIRPKDNNNSLQFVKIQTPELSKKAVEQIKLAEETKISKSKIKEVEEEWQNHLSEWKSKRRQQFSHKPEPSDLNNDNFADSPGGRKIKTFAEMLRERNSSGRNRLGFNLQRYIGTEDDNVTDESQQHDQNYDNTNYTDASTCDEPCSNDQLDGDDNERNSREDTDHSEPVNGDSSVSLNDQPVCDYDASQELDVCDDLNHNKRLVRNEVIHKGRQSVSFDDSFKSHVDHQVRNNKSEHIVEEKLVKIPSQIAQKDQSDLGDELASLSINEKAQRPGIESERYGDDYEDDGDEEEDIDEDDQEEQMHMQRVAFEAKLKAFERLTKPKIEPAPPVPSRKEPMVAQSQIHKLGPKPMIKSVNNPVHPAGDNKWQLLNSAPNDQHQRHILQIEQQRKVTPPRSPEIKPNHQPITPSFDQKLFVPQSAEIVDPSPEVPRQAITFNDQQKMPSPTQEERQIQSFSPTEITKKPISSNICRPQKLSADNNQIEASPSSHHLMQSQQHAHHYLEQPVLPPVQNQHPIAVPTHQQRAPLPIQDDKDKPVLSVSGKKRCSSCREELGRGAAAFVVESLSLVYHTNCFRCSVCHVNLSNGFRGVDVRVHAGALHCQNCYSKDGLNYSRV